ncbi:MAG: ATP-dependent DNA helicase RecG [Candidatus Omnitrophica bacterium]|jgi:ATP-dependent DNA helicase RecG|nr:ATP-dependent DNA helicase RecG [Candidatus Omnitrophota bacterium]
MLQTDLIRYLKGVGPKKEEIFNKVGIYTLDDILHYFPFRYEDRRNFKKIKDIKENEFCVIKGKILARNLKKMPYFLHAKRVKNILEIAISDDTAVTHCTWFNQGYLYDKMTIGDTLIVYGKPRAHDGKLKLISPEFEIFEEGEDSLNLGRIVGVYSSTQNLGQKFIRKTISLALENLNAETKDSLPFDIRRGKNFPNIAQALKAIHFPQSFEEAEKSRERFIFEELFFSQILVYLRKAKHRSQIASPFKINAELIEKLKQNLKFSLTASQDKVLSEILEDLQKNYPMHRLLQGDVGCGKTVVCAFAVACAVSSGFQAAFMVPTEILAYQHTETLRNFFDGFGYRIEVLVASLSKKEIEKIHKELLDGKIDIVIGTHALLSDEVAFKNLRLVAIDEQHKFGVAQRALLPKKGINPHYLIMSATPIPRSLALSLYGDLDLSVITELPKGRIAPKTMWVREDKRPWVYDFIKEKVSAGRQAYIIYPVIEENEDEDLRSLEVMYGKLKKKFSKFKIGMFHGRLKPQQKLSVINEFREGKIDILVSTTVVEVGVNVLNATVMVVENPERFGLAQLHQLRGRIQRSTHAPYFILLSGNEICEEVSQRLKALEESNDGFRIAEEDLKLRGPGDFFGRMQHGLPDLRIANPLRDIELLKEARVFAYKIIKNDPQLQKPEHRFIRERIDSLFGALKDSFSLLKNNTDDHRLKITNDHR